jgi:hypothetical protein
MGIFDGLQQQQPQGGGVFAGLGQAGAAPAAPGAPQGGSPQGIQMAMQLAQNPTPQMAQQIIQQLHQMGNPEAKQFEQMLTQVMNNPQALKQLADSVVQKLGGGQ